MFDTSTFPGYSQTLELVKNTFARIIASSDRVPQHVAFIMDGNRRYAKRHHIEVKEGHNAGFLSMSKVLELCYETGVKTATVYAFSIENFKRSSFEVNWLMDLARERIRQIVQNGEMAEKYGIRIRVIGDRSLLPKDVIDEIERAESITRDNTRAVLNVCFPYTGREEIIHSVKAVISQVQNQDYPAEAIDERKIDDNLYTAGLPPVELLIRTSGITRLSDFLIWQLSKKGVVIEFLDCLWPEFGPIKMAWILLKFAFGKTFSTKEHHLEEYDEEDQVESTRAESYDTKKGR